MTANKEIELKLRTDPDGMAILLGSPRLLTASRDGKYWRMHAIYYDTQDLALYGKGVSFRVRDEDGRYVQTVKIARKHAGAMVRDERQVDVPSMLPRPDWLDGSSELNEVAVLAPDDLIPLFATTYDRLASLITFEDASGGSSLIEIACDRGSISSQDGKTEISEIELELLKGDPGALYELALELHGHYPVHVETCSKSDRGYDLVSGRRPTWRKSQKIELASDVTIDEAMDEIFRTRFGDWLANERAAVDGRDPEGVHQVRVALRRLRSALVMFGPFMPEEQLAWLKAESRWLASSMGPARDLDVFLTEILEPVAEVRRDDRGLLAIRHRTEEARALAYEEARYAIASPRYGRFVLEYGHWLETGAWRKNDAETRPASLDDPLAPWAAKVLNRRYRDVVKLGRGLKSASNEQRHEMRIAVKKLRYSMEFVPAGYPERKVKEFRQDLTQLQDDLGHMNDVAVTEARLDHLVADHQAGASMSGLNKASGLILGWCARSAQDAQMEIFDVWNRFQQKRPFWRAEK